MAYLLFAWIAGSALFCFAFVFVASRPQPQPQFDSIDEASTATPETLDVTPATTSRVRNSAALAGHCSIP